MRGKAKPREVEFTNMGQSQPLAPFIQHQVLYLFQEALTNIAKHAQARHVGIDLTWAANALTITVSDDGCGFESGAIEADGHFGLRVMQERAEAINGYLTLASRPNAGTELILRLPLDPVAKIPPSD